MMTDQMINLGDEAVDTVQMIDLGDEVVDTITGFIGIVIAKSQWLNGCIRLTVQPQGIKDGKSIAPETIDVEQLKILEVNKANCQFRSQLISLDPAALEHNEQEPPRKATGGPFPAVTRRDEILV